MYFLSYQLNELINKTIVLYQKNITEDFSIKPSPQKWSKKEILGHLIDSAMNNTRRFTESQFAKTTYNVIAYDQDELVKVNHYQDKQMDDLINLWFHLNKHIAFIFQDVSEEKLNIEINLYDQSFCNLEFLLEDYIEHLKYHLKQIFNEI
jgi:hypothetical protein